MVVLDLQKIECFLALAQYLNFTKAAESLYKTQSVLSRNILSMEEELGIRLFIRTKRSVYLTPAGKRLAEGFRHMLEFYDIVTEQAQAINAGYEGTLNICMVAGQSVSGTFAPILQGFKKKYSSINVNVAAKNVAEIRYRLQNRQIDFAYGRNVEFSTLIGLEYQPIVEMRVCFAAHKFHPAAALFSKISDDSALDRYPFIWTQELESRVVDRLLFERQQRMGDANVLYAPDLNTMLLWIELGYGFSLLNENSYFARNLEARFYPTDFYGKTSEGLIWHTDAVNPCVRTLVEFAREYRESFHIN